MGRRGRAGRGAAGDALIFYTGRSGNVHLRRLPHASPVRSATAVKVMGCSAPHMQNPTICVRSRRSLTRQPGAPSRRSVH